MDEYPLSKVFQLIEPGPVVLVTTADKGKANVMTMSWHMAMAFEPALIGCVIGPWDYSFEALSATGECVIAIPGMDLATTVVEVGNCSGRDVDKFATFDLSPVPAAVVRAPLVAECLANLECRVVNTTLRDEYALFILEAVKAWTNPARQERRTFHANGDGTFVVDGQVLDLKSKMVKLPDYFA